MRDDLLRILTNTQDHHSMLDRELVSGFPDNFYRVFKWCNVVSEEIKVSLGYTSCDRLAKNISERNVSVIKKIN